ncbi:MAG: methyltransferase [Oscillospiraceae bacterium]|nr:methyltransferase [Oscillospiraceae bacterium]
MEFMNVDEFVETLGKGVSVLCSSDHGFGTDAILLANFSGIKSRDIACDMGTGCGIIPLLWLRDGAKNDIYGVDIQERAIDQFTKSIELSGFPSNVHPVLHDLREIEKVLSKGSFNLVTMNPPYKEAGTGIMSETTADQIARHETMCTINDVVKAGATLLNFGGRFCMCHRPERLCDVICAMREYGLEPKRIRFVQKRPDTAPWLFLIEGKKGAKPHLTVMPPLIIQDENGNNSKELDGIIGEYAERNS